MASTAQLRPVIGCYSGRGHLVAVTACTSGSILVAMTNEASGGSRVSGWWRSEGMGGAPWRFLKDERKLFLPPDNHRIVATPNWAQPRWKETEDLVQLVECLLQVAFDQEGQRTANAQHMHRCIIGEEDKSFVPDPHMLYLPWQDVPQSTAQLVLMKKNLTQGDVRTWVRLYRSRRHGPWWPFGCSHG